MGDQTWEAYFTDTPPPEPSLTKIITDLRKRVLVSPVFVCLVCTKESSSQQHMAVHCKKHVQAGMAKGTVKHIKYYPDHTTCYFFGINPQPTPRDSGSANRVRQVPMPSYKTVLSYAGSAFVSHLASMLPENPSGVSPVVTPTGDMSTIDLTLRLGSTPGTIAGALEGMTLPLHGSSRSANNIHFGDDPKGKKVIPGPYYD
ncbi:uncharacterized protein LOC120701926 [Panicum virgatum]|uniref:Uncharacterized protein n=1 Tax=Panicum virgatum TaxID=38727 RepID=A0A8T0TPJ9_PANVG|nr:uncharacterized protein LOC120701926 [Panicum virgatum]KAG2610975.1 hypothetical protein PVAP13_4KG219500 [Panicum virgatum]